MGQNSVITVGQISVIVPKGVSQNGKISGFQVSNALKTAYDESPLCGDRREHSDRVKGLFIVVDE